MIRVVTSQPGDRDAVVVRIGTHPVRDPDAATIGVHVADPDLAAAITSALCGSLASAAAAYEPLPCPVVCLRSRKRLAEVREQLAGAIAVVGVTPRNARRLVELVDGCRAAGALGVQLVWDGTGRDRIERHVFAALEHARATPALAPVVLADAIEPVPALQLLIAHRARPR